MKKNIVYLSQITIDELRNYMITVAKELKLNKTYPKFNEWYNEKIIDSIEKRNNTRDIIFMFVRNGSITEIGGLSIVKKTPDENKICTLFVVEKYRKNGIAKELFKESFKYLNDKKPLFTVSEDNYNEFKNLINEFDFELKEVKHNYYANGKTEYVYNGFL
jgi:ribosomal protein S18 acetylase RimI-like enzyme